MNGDSPSTLPAPNTQPEVETNNKAVASMELPKLQIQLKNEDGVVKLILPTGSETPASASWDELWEQLQQRLQGSRRFWQPLARVHLIAHDRLIDARQLQAIKDRKSVV